MELDVIELNSFVLRCPSLSLIVGLVVESQFEIRHSSQLTVGIDNSNDLTLDDVVGGSDEHGQLFNNIKEKLILGVLDALRSP